MKILGFGGAETAGVFQKPTYLMSGRLRDVTLNNHLARLSVRWVQTGRYVYEVDRQRFVLEPGNFLVLNVGQTYNSAVERHTLTDSLTVSFDDKILGDVHAALTQTAESLLDGGGERVAPPAIQFLNDAYRAGEKLQNLLTHFAAESLKPRGATALDESFYALMRQLLEDRQQINRQIAGIAGAKKSTREELFRRIRRARDFIRANSANELKIDIIAAEANMSPYHFLRTYKQAFGVTPHQELLQMRLDTARSMMQSRRPLFSLARIASTAGFSDLSSFSKAFKKQFGIAPSRFADSKPNLQFER